MAWEKGQSGNPNGRPRKGCSLIDQLETALDVEDHEGKPKRVIICENIVHAAAVNKDQKAISKIFDVLQRDHEFSKKCEIEARLDEIEKRLEEAK